MGNEKRKEIQEKYKKRFPNIPTLENRFHFSLIINIFIHIKMNVYSRNISNEKQFFILKLFLQV